jgi:hypothetical protein
VLADDERSVLVEAESPTIMKKVSELLPPHGIELKWVRGQSVVPTILQKVSTRILSYNTNSEKTGNCIGRFVSRSEKDGMAVPYVPQLLDHLSSRQRQ